LRPSPAALNDLPKLVLPSGKKVECANGLSISKCQRLSHPLLAPMITMFVANAL
jgi:hypothetical protein